MTSTIGNKDFKGRLRSATQIVKERLKAKPTDTLELFTPVLRSGAYEWIVAMETDGTLVRARSVKQGEARKLVAKIELLIGVIIQSEWETGLTKPNPFGKATVGVMPHGIWVDLGAEGRRRLDRIYVLFVVQQPPSNESAKIKKKHGTVSRNVDNATYAIPDTDVVQVRRGASANAIADEIEKKVRPWLNGKGRPYKRK